RAPRRGGVRCRAARAGGSPGSRSARRVRRGRGAHALPRGGIREVRLPGLAARGDAALLPIPAELHPGGGDRRAAADGCGGLVPPGFPPRARGGRGHPLARRRGGPGAPPPPLQPPPPPLPPPPPSARGPEPPSPP